MTPSGRVEQLGESVTLALSAKAKALKQQGRPVFDLTSGQLSLPPPPSFIDCIKKELESLESFQYEPVQGNHLLKKKIHTLFEKNRQISLPEHDSLVGNGAKHIIFNIMASLINPGDEVILISPYWVTYPEMVKFFSGKIRMVETGLEERFIPSLAKIDELLSSQTKLLIINSPNNPTGVHYPQEWMKEFATLLSRHPHTFIISDEIYHELNYRKPAPVYFYQYAPKLLKRTFLVHGISKTLASTGLRIGYCSGPSSLVKAMGRLQGQSTSCASSLIQRALNRFDFDRLNEFLHPINTSLQANVDILEEKLHQNNLSSLCYHPQATFYYMLDISSTKKLQHIKNDNTGDYSLLLCEQLLEKNIAVVPGSAFGYPNSIRLSLLLQKDSFSKAVDNLLIFLNGED